MRWAEGEAARERSRRCRGVQPAWIARQAAAISSGVGSGRRCAFDGNEEEAGIGFSHEIGQARRVGPMANDEGTGARRACEKREAPEPVSMSQRRAAKTTRNGVRGDRSGASRIETQQIALRSQFIIHLYS